jgi:nucleolin
MSKSAQEVVVDAAAGTAAAAGYAFQPKEDRRESRPYGGDRDGGRGSFGGGYGDRNGGGRSFDRGADRRGPREVAPMTPTPTVYIGNLLFDITANDLEQEFGQFGEIKSAIIATDPRGMSKG